MNIQYYLEKTFAAVAFCEANEHGLAKEILAQGELAVEKRPVENKVNLENLSAAVAMAEGGLSDEALRLCALDQEANKMDLDHFLHDVGLKPRQVWYATAPL